MANVVMNMHVSANPMSSWLQKVFVLHIPCALRDKFLCLSVLLTVLKTVVQHMNVYVKRLSNVKSVLKVRDHRTSPTIEKMAGPLISVKVKYLLRLEIILKTAVVLPLIATNLVSIFSV